MGYVSFHVWLRSVRVFSCYLGIALIFLIRRTRITQFSQHPDHVRDTTERYVPGQRCSLLRLSLFITLFSMLPFWVFRLQTAKKKKKSACQGVGRSLGAWNTCWEIPSNRHMNLFWLPAVCCHLFQEFAAVRIWWGRWGCIMVAVAFSLRYSSVSFLLLAVVFPPCLGLQCKEHQYPFGKKCCKYCAPGKWFFPIYLLYLCDIISIS